MAKTDLALQMHTHRKFSKLMAKFLVLPPFIKFFLLKLPGETFFFRPTYFFQFILFLEFLKFIFPLHIFENSRHILLNYTPYPLQQQFHCVKTHRHYSYQIIEWQCHTAILLCTTIIPLCLTIH